MSPNFVRCTNHHDDHFGTRARHLYQDHCNVDCSTCMLYEGQKAKKKTKQGKRVFNPRTPKHKKYILPTYSRENAYVLWWELVVWSSFIWVSYEKSSSSYCSMQYFWWGCRGNLKLITLGSERVNRLRYYVHHQLPPQILLTLQVSVLLTMGYHCSPGVLDRVHVHLPAQAPVPRYCVAR